LVGHTHVSAAVKASLKKRYPVAFAIENDRAKTERPDRMFRLKNFAAVGCTVAKAASKRPIAFK
jgi:hypothetical protein